MINTTRAGYTPPGTTHARKFRKSPAGRPQPVDVEPAPTWHQLVAPGPRPTGVRRPFNVDGPAVSYALTESKDVPGPVPGQASRRERRPSLVASAKRARRTRRQQVSA